MPQLCTFGASSARGFGLTEETGPGLPDDQFNLTTLLLPGNGTNGAQNNTFLDSSTNNLTITRNGNTTQGTFSPFSFGGGTAQADGYYSGYFDGTGDYLTIPSSTAFNFGTGNFTIQGWVYMFAYTAGGAGPALFGTTNGATTGYYINLGGDVNGLRITSNASGSWTDNITVSTGNGVNLNQWTHIALVRNGASLILYKNGVNVASTSSAASWNFSSPNNAGYIGRVSNGISTQELTGYISNLRVSNVAETISVPTTPLTAIANTSLLTCQSSQFIDNSTNAFAITPVGNSQPVPTNPFGMTDWSGYFDGTGDYLTVANNAAFDLGSGNATIEAWIYPTSSGQTCGIFDKRSSGGNYSQFPQIALVSGAFVAYVSYSGSSWAGTINGATPAANTWTHVAFVRSGNTWTLYVNGVVSGTPFTASGSVYTSTDSLVIGASTTTGTNGFAGQISNARVVKGTAVYTANFTPPTAPLTAISGTSLLTCQSSTFVDNSTNAFTITVNGNSYMGTLNNPFNSPVNYTTPPLQAWSNYFDGTGDYLSVASNAALGVGSGDFTVECWIYLTQNFDATGQGVVTASYNTNFAAIGTNSGAGNRIDFYVANVILTSGTNYISLNTWTHLAFVRLAGTTRIYFNGVQVASSGSLTGTGAAAALYVGTLSHDLNQEMTGYISNVRLVKGTAVYTAAFTPPTAPLTAITNTSLLTCQSNRFVDNSINQFAITRNGDTSVQPFSPFNPDAAYSTTSVGGSAYFDGTGDSLTIPGSSAFDFGTGNFTAEAWVYPMGASSDMSMIDFWIGGGGSYVVGQWQLTFYTSDTLSFVWASGSNSAARITSPSSTLPKNTWTHIAVTRTGNLFQIFTNGVLGASTTLTQAIGTTSSGRIGIQTVNNAAPFTGYISGARILKGTSLYTTGFVPPAAPFTAVTNTQLLLNYTNAGIPDATAKNVLETVGNAQISTAQSKFGGSSMAFDGTGDYIVQPTNLSYGYGTGDFTIEFWLRLNTTSIQTIISNLTSAASTNPHIYINSTLYYYTANAIRITGASLSAGQWYHIAVCRASGSTRLFINGTQSGSTYADTNNYGATAPLGIGTYWASGSPVTTDTINGYIDDLRITKGYARYTTNFTPPTQAFPLF